ncbi:unnamed protein product [Echinostoma caproni]|uniref:Uncharacterized protein n=1 Tax=Echinostoma caproni TaxID=27848 RepID=A0A3P8GFN1_9TREM|nr:unnamed protein product [Echinostoma caproni]
MLEFLEHGGVLCLQELCVSPHGKEIDKRWALQVLSCVANAGTRYKETICECYGIRAVAECMAKSTSEETQEAARNLLEILAEGNPRFADQVYKGLIGVLPCHSPKAQQLALQTIRVLQSTRETANRALIDRIIYLLESLHLEVQSAVIELVRDLMHFDIADDILAALVALLRPQREIQLGKLFTEAASSSDFSSACSDSEDSEGSDSHPHSGKSATPHGPADNNHPTGKEDKLGTAGTGRKPKITFPGKKSPITKRSKRPVQGISPVRGSVRTSTNRVAGTHLSRSGSAQPHSGSLGALSSLLYALGNLEFPDSQRQASLTVEILIEKNWHSSLIKRNDIHPDSDVVVIHR